MSDCRACQHDGSCAFHPTPAPDQRDGAVVVARLKAEINLRVKEHLVACQTIDKRDAELARLREEVAALRMIPSHGGCRALHAELMTHLNAFHENARLERENSAHVAEKAVLMEALSFYADPREWGNATLGVYSDLGKRARALVKP